MAYGGRREVYNNTPQGKPNYLTLATFGEPNDPADFKEKPPVNPSEVREYLEQMIFKIEEATWQRVVRAFIESIIKSSSLFQLLKQIIMLLKVD